MQSATRRYAGWSSSVLSLAIVVSFPLFCFLLCVPLFCLGCAALPALLLEVLLLGCIGPFLGVELPSTGGAMEHLISLAPDNKLAALLPPANSVHWTAD